jgi:S1-C subfamily serine protease
MRSLLVVSAILAGFVAVAAVSGAAAGGAVTWWWLGRQPAAGALPGAAGSATAELATYRGAGPTEEELALSAVRRTRPAVVTVWNVGYVRPGLFSQPELRVVGEGSGVVFDERGYIATNAHVVQGAQEIAVVFLDGHSETAQLVGLHEDYDVAVLRVEGEAAVVAPLADSSLLEPGMRVMAIGSPLGTQYQNTVTTGIVAGVNRRVTERYLNWFTGQPVEFDLNEAPLIQTDAAINTGNSGGPLINLAGEVVALNTLIVRREGGSDIEGLGFAVPSNVVRALADEWIDGVRRGWLGAEHETIDPARAREERLDRASGALLGRVWAGSPAAEAGLRPGDIITSINGVALDLDHALADQLWRYRAGDRIALGIARGDATFDVDITLAATPRE